MGTQELVGILEQHGMIIELSEIIYQLALKALIKLKQKISNSFYISINASPFQLIQHDFTLKLIQLSTQYGIETQDIHIGVTETAFLKSNDNVKLNLQALRKEGFKLSIDDFGTGYSSLSYLREYPFTTLKIDRSFILQLPNTQESCCLLKSIMDISQGFGLNVVAEGIENPAQLEFLRAQNCSLVQGYLYSKPQNLPELIEHLHCY